MVLLLIFIFSYIFSFIFFTFFVINIAGTIERIKHIVNKKDKKDWKDKEMWICIGSSMVWIYLFILFYIY